MQTTLAKTDQEFETPALQIQEFEDAAMPVWFSGKDYDDTLKAGDKVFICDFDYEEFGEVFEFVAYHALTDCFCFIKRLDGREIQKPIHTKIIRKTPDHLVITTHFPS